jgi:hypothetical protein
MICEVAVERARRTGAVGESYIAVGSEQIKRVASEARFFILGSPLEYVERGVSSRTPCSELGAGRPVDVDLPIHR